MREIIVMLDNIRSALNVGAIFRTCDGAGVKKIYLAGITPDPSHPKIAKTALNAESFMSYEKVNSLQESIEQYKKNGFEIISIEEGITSENLFEKSRNLPDKLCLIFGHEITGVSNESVELSDHVFHLPMVGKKNSLNVSTTVGIVTYYLQFGHE